MYQTVGALMKQDGVLIIEAANLKRDGEVTTLAWDLGLRLANAFAFVQEIVVAWDRYGYGYDHSYCLIYRHRN